MARDKQNIKRVALYLRKSRDENQEDALIKHRARLTRLCKKRDYQIIEVFEEIQSGKTLRKRPEMLRLLESIRTQNIEGIVVVEIDRLGRTDLEDWGYVLKIFQAAKTFLITPETIYDPTDSNETFMLNIGSSLAHLELAKFSKRVKEGKVEGTILGKWTNGKPPYPYLYKKTIRNISGKDITEGNVVVDENKAKIYRMIIENLA